MYKSKPITLQKQVKSKYITLLITLLKDIFIVSIPKKSNIHVFIGVSHTESRFLNTDKLLNVLQKVKPD